MSVAWEYTDGLESAERAKIAVMSETAAELTRLYKEVRRLEEGCTHGLVLNRCERRAGHEGKHWNDAIGAWWFDGVTTRTEREGILP